MGKDRSLTKKSGGNKKKGRNLAKCKVYRMYGRRERNKARRYAQMIRGFRTSGLGA